MAPCRREDPNRIIIPVSYQSRLLLILLLASMIATPRFIPVAVARLVSIASAWNHHASAPPTHMSLLGATRCALIGSKPSTPQLCSNRNVLPPILFCSRFQVHHPNTAASANYNREFFLRDTWRSGSWSACDTHAKPEVTYLIPGLLHPLTFRDYINRVYPHQKRRVSNGDCIANANGHGRAHSKSFTTPGFATSIVAADGQ